MRRFVRFSRGVPLLPDKRRGAFMVLAFFCLIATLAFVAFSIDTGNIALNKTLMQNAVDSAALAAAMEITSAVENAPADAQDPTAYAREQAKLMAVQVANLNGVFVDANYDVTFGLRSYNPGSQSFEIQWGVEPANAVKVRARKDNVDTTAPDGKLPMMFAGVLGDKSVRMQAEAIAFIEARDIAVVLDFSQSMNYDSIFYTNSISTLGADAIRDNLREMFWELELADSALGTLDQVEPNNSNSARTTDVKYLKVTNTPPSSDHPTITATFMYNQVALSSNKAYKSVKLRYSSGSQTFSNLNTSGGTYVGTSSNASKDVTGVDVVVTIPGTGAVTKSGTMSGGSPNPTATVQVNEAGSQASVSISTNSISQIRVTYTDGTTSTWSYSSGTSKTVSASNGKVIQDVRVRSASGASRTFSDFDVSPAYDYTVVLDDTNANVRSYFKIANVSWPYPSGSWDGYINYVRSDSEVNNGGHREMYGPITFVHYLVDTLPRHTQVPALSKTSHYPFHAVRKGNELFVDFLQNLGFGDHVGL
ncbi:MAG: hypothetical protein KF861_20590, partial [Planctomycetaceae bacterium]|nr:hypothetical protein [Planctomycetaceae bacterium]